ncbi:MAG: nuclear transport factor 2 family protein [Bryobacterales bacterium]
MLSVDMRTLLLSVLIGRLPERCPQPLKKEVLAAMEAWRQATESKDVAALGKLLHEDLSYSHSDGKTETRADVLAGLLASGKREIVIHDPMRVYGKTAIVKADLDFINRESGEPSAVRLNVLHVLLKTPSGWQLTAWQSTRINR